LFRESEPPAAVPRRELEHVAREHALKPLQAVGAAYLERPEIGSGHQ
jgi:hypothetical protein